MPNLSQKQIDLIKLYAKVAKKVAGGQLEFFHIKFKEEVERTARIKKGFSEFIKDATQENFRKLWSEELIYAARQQGNASNLIKKNGLKKISDIMNKISMASEYDPGWEDDMGAKNTLREFWSKLKDQPIQNGCAYHGLMFFGYPETKTYDQFKEAYNDFKEKYLGIVGRGIAPFPIEIELDQLFNTIDKTSLDDLRLEDDPDVKTICLNILLMKNNYSLKNKLQGYLGYINKDIGHYIEDEGYKFKAVAEFQSKFDLKAKDFGTMIDGALSAAKNLIESGNYYPRRMLAEYYKLKPDATKQAFVDLLDESKDIRKRINSFVNLFETINQEARKLGKMPKAQNTYIDYRFISFILAAIYPEKYCYVKYDEYQSLIKELWLANRIPNESDGNRFILFNSFAQIIREFLKTETKFLETHKQLVKDCRYKDESLSWGVWDFIFNYVRRVAQGSSDEARENEHGLPLIFKVSQGQGADNRNYTEYSIKNSKLILGWFEGLSRYDIDELNQINQEENFKQYLISRSIAALTAKKCWDFRQAPMGTIAIANKGRSGILAIGSITESKIYYSENDLPNRPDKGNLNYKKINWVVTAPVKGQNIFNEIHTIEQINAGQWQKIKDLYFATYPDQKEELTNKFNILENNYKNMTLPKNLILYGPPGTGKTYQAREMAKNLLSGQAKTETKEESIGKIIKELTWLDIIGVIMRIMGDGKYRVPELIKNSIAKTAAELKNRTSKLNPTFWGLMQLHSNEASETVKFSRRSGLNLFDKDEQSRWYLTETGKEYFADDRYNEIIGQLKNIKAGTKDWKEYHDFITFHQSYSYEEFIEGIRPVLDSEDESVRYELKDGVFKRICRKAEQAPANKYLLVIDEINRGNISKIFGELLTLVEEDKRIGEQNQITVTLPYSGQAFSVPANLYILGTMNTADRSIALLDVALRRRFKFQELMPEYKATGLDDLTIGNLNLGRLLNKINSKIEVMVDRDHQIGHSYFMKIGKDDKEALHNAWYGEVVPLLQEYFYNDWAKLAQILGKYNTTSQTGFIEMRDNKYIRDLFIDNAAEDYIDSSVGNVYQYEPEALVKALENLL